MTDTTETVSATPAQRDTRSWFARTALASALFLGASALSLVASALIAEQFASRPQPDDLLLRALPYLPQTGRLVDVFATIAPLLVLVHFVRHRRDEIPTAVAIFGLTVLLRAGIVVLTPLASPHEGMVATGVFKGSQGLFPGQNGMFPSGHAANVLLCYLLIDGTRDVWLRRAALVCSFGLWITLLLSKMHYSIDIVGGVLLAYFVFHEWSRGRAFTALKRVID